MNFQEYSDKMKEIQSKFLQFLDNEDNIEENYENLINIIKDLESKQHEIKIIVNIIAAITNNHRRSPNFFNKIERILLFLKNHIKNIFTNFEVFNIFQGNSRIILFLIQSNMLNIDRDIFITLKKNNQYQYFIPEFKKIVDDEKNTISEKYKKTINQIYTDISDDYDEKRNIGENENYINELIRKDDIEKFIIFVNKENIRLDSLVTSSIYETNSFLLQKTSLIEYAAFFGSIQIFKYLYLNGVRLNSSLWMYGIHGDCPELIHILEENKIEAKNYYICLKEAIKCHHNDVANYIRENYIIDESKHIKDFYFDINDKYFNNNVLSYSFQYYNFAFISIENANFFTFYYACRYDYYTIVEFFQRTRKMYLQYVVFHFDNFMIKFF